MTHVLREVFANAAMKSRSIRAWRVRKGRTACHASADQIDLFHAQFRMFIDSVGLENIREKTIVEVGPGDVIPHALLFLGAGARQYVAIDRFLGDINGAAAFSLYKAVLQDSPLEIQTGLERIGFEPLQSDWLDRAIADNRVVLVREAIEDPAVTELTKADVIVSYNVVEHLSDIDAAFRHMSRIIRPGGVMVHRVDYGPHGCWIAYNNPLTFLVFSDALWSLMGDARGYPNRRRHSHVLASLERNGFRSECRNVTHFPAEFVQQIRPRLAPDFRRLADADLTPRDAQIVCYKT